MTELDEGQIHVLSHLAAGHTASSLAVHLRLARNTLGHEISVIRAEIGVATTDQAVAWAAERDLLISARELDPSPAWTTPEVAAALGISLYSVHTLFDVGELPVLWCGTALRVPDAAVADYRRRRQAGTAWAPRPRTVLTGHDRTRTAAELRDRYQVGATIRDLATATGYSYAFVRRLLTEAGAPLRGRGGDTRR